MTTMLRVRACPRARIRPRPSRSRSLIDILLPTSLLMVQADAGLTDPAQGGANRGCHIEAERDSCGQRNRRDRSDDQGVPTNDEAIERALGLNDAQKSPEYCDSGNQRDDGRCGHGDGGDVQSLRSDPANKR